ncbi:sigma-70 family RNA polymerase sigma factor [Spirochaetes bacterium]|uniref:Sigma-70 family RNA polymerase sigma factor n=1 Tax=Candidatus Scatousia excrementipullorum TaxID=2840936 RepID=A0A9D9DSV8_9BACT|nr:sigma-70 family RNA polymerase sigma factor [Candidatus Scatousia excrementipullorum]
MDFKEIIKTNKENVKNIIRMITKEENEDLEQEVYLKVWKNSEKYKEKGSFKGWITTIAKNVSKDYLKSAVNRHESLLVSEEDKTFENIKDKKSTPELKLLKNERQEKILKAINKLKPKFKEVIVYCEIYGYTYEDCAKRIKCPVGTVKSRIYNAKKILAETLSDLM